MSELAGRSRALDRSTGLSKLHSGVLWLVVAGYVEEMKSQYQKPPSRPVLVRILFSFCFLVAIAIGTAAAHRPLSRSRWLTTVYCCYCACMTISMSRESPATVCAVSSARLQLAVVDGLNSEKVSIYSK